MWLPLSLLLLAAPAAEDPTLVIVPLQDPDEALVEMIADSVRERFHLEVKVVDNMEMPEEAWYKPRKRWRADVILDTFDELELENAEHVAGITEKPISTTKGDYYDWGVAGLGALDGRSSVLSSYYFRNYRKQPKKYQRYMENLVLHEVGHTLGLDHCPLERCIMADAKGKAVTAAEKSVNELCPRCTRLIQSHVRTREVDVEWTEEELEILRNLP